MARVYKASNVTPAALTNAFFAQLRTPSTARARLRAVSMFQTSSSVAVTVGLIRSASVGATFTTTVVGQAVDPSDVASVVNLDTAITTAPTISGSPVYLDRWTLPATIGTGIVIFFPDSIIIPVSSSILLWNYGASTGAAMHVSFMWEE